MPTDLVLFDLDETLLRTELLLDARHSHWPVDLATIEGYARVTALTLACYRAPHARSLR